MNCKRSLNTIIPISGQIGVFCVPRLPFEATFNFTIGCRKEVYSVVTTLTLAVRQGAGEKKGSWGRCRCVRLSACECGEKGRGDGVKKRLRGEKGGKRTRQIGGSPGKEIRKRGKDVGKGSFVWEPV